MIRRALCVLLVIGGSALVPLAPTGAAEPIVVTTTADVVDAADGVLSLREAVDLANAQPGSDLVQLAADAGYDLTICGAEGHQVADNTVGDLDATDPAGLEVLGSRTIIEQTCADDRLLQTSAAGLDTASLVIQGVRFEGGSGVAGGVVVDGDLRLEEVEVVRVDGTHSLSKFVSAVHATGELTASDSYVGDNTGIAGLTAGGDLTVTDSYVERNGGRELRAGGVWADGDVVVDRSVIAENVAADTTLAPAEWGEAGGVSGYGNITVTGSRVGGNTGFVGGVGAAGGSVTIHGSTVDGNFGAVGGGVSSHAFAIANSNVVANRAGFGGAIVGGGSIAGSTIMSNKAVRIDSAGGGGSGGAILASHDLQITLSTVTDNSAVTGSALLVEFDGADHLVVVTDSTISDNPVDATGPGPFPTPPAEIWHGQGPSEGEIRFERSAVGTAGSRACSGGGIPITGGPYSFASDDTCFTTVSPTTIVGGGDPQLGPLSDPIAPTPVRFPEPGSPLKDRIPVDHPGCGGLDQQGIERPQGLGCDIGAAERQVGPRGFVPIAPVRILDTRSTPHPGGWASGSKLTPEEQLDLPVAGVAGVPDTATAVVLNVTSTEAESPLGYVVAWPSGLAPPPTSVLNLQPGANVANSITIAPGVGQEVTFATNTGATHLVVDVLGYYGVSIPEEAGFTTTEPVRALDTRAGPVPAGRAVGQRLTGPGTIRLPVAGVGAVPADATAVVGNITATEGSTNHAFITAWPSGAARPLASNLNLQPEYNVSNLAVVKVGAGGAIDLYTNTGSTHVVFDIVGYFREGSGDRFLPVSPARVYDSRDTGLFGPGTSRSAVVAGAHGVHGQATAVVLSATSAAASSSGGFLTVHPKGVPLPSPLTSNLNYRPPYNAPNQVMVAVGRDRSVTLRNGFGTVHLILDVSGYFVAQ